MTNIVTAEQVYDTTGLTVDFTDIATAQSVIEACTGLNLSWDEPSLHYTKRDFRILKSAVTAQVAYLDKNQDVLNTQANVSSMSNNGVSISFTSGASDGYLSPLAARYLDTLSTSATGDSTVDVAPFRAPLSAEYGFDPLWQPVGRYSL